MLMDLPEVPLDPLFEEKDHDHHPVKRLALLIGGGLCILLGIVVWITPIVTGAPALYLAGAVLLAGASKTIACWLNRQERKLAYKYRLLLRPKLRKRLKAEVAAAAEEEPS